MILYGTVAWYFAGVMVRLMLTLAPIACILAAIGISTTLRRFCGILKTTVVDSTLAPIAMIVILFFSSLLISYTYHATFVSSMAYSSPSIVIEAGRTPTGERVIFDDYREAYYWLRQNTPSDSKILSWWDYGYQMSSMANRTVLVDNNTWNNTHIATVGRAMASTEEDAYPIFQSLDVDYVLVIFGGLTGYSSDDINKFLWPVRIGSGVFPNEMPSEEDFMSRTTGQYDIGPDGSPYLLNCVVYKACYYRFSEMQTDYSKPAGFDRARNAVVGVKDIKLTHMEEAFTSEHWIVRIFKILPPANVEPTSKVARESVKKATANVNSIENEHATFLGCVTQENQFSEDKIYSGSQSGANYRLALHHAVNHNKKYFALSRVDGEGHAFAFDSFDQNMNGNDKGCTRPCMDSAEHYCGCADKACEELGLANKEEGGLRRWAVYGRTTTA